MARKDVFDNPKHYENPKLYSRGLRLSNFSELFFISGYSAASGPPDGSGPPVVEYPNDAISQMQWIVESLDAYIANVPYSDGTGHYSVNDVIYFDLVLSSTIDGDTREQALYYLESWFASADTKPSTGILKMVEALASPEILVEMELILAH